MQPSAKVHFNTKLHRYKCTWNNKENNASESIAETLLKLYNVMILPSILYGSHTALQFP